MSTEDYKLRIFRRLKKLDIAITALDAAHAQGQAMDISRSLDAERFSLAYGKTEKTILSELYRKLAYNEFNHKDCEIWDHSLTNGCPSLYALSRRYYVRPLVLGYLDISKEGVVKTTCGNSKCVNPYHNQYLSSKNSKLGSGDKQMLLAFRSQGVSIPQIAKALNVHRSTIYRILKNERLLTGDEDQRHGDP